MMDRLHSDDLRAIVAALEDSHRSTYATVEISIASADELLAKLGEVSIEKLKAALGEAALFNAKLLTDIDQLQQDRDKFKDGCRKLEMAEAEAMALVLQHEGHIAKLEAELQRVKFDLHQKLG